LKVLVNGPFIWGQPAHSQCSSLVRSFASADTCAGVEVVALVAVIVAAVLVDPLGLW